MTLQAHLFGGVNLEGRLANASYLLLRGVTGLLLAFNHGLNKLPPSEKFIEGVGNMGFSMPHMFAWAASISEFAGGLLLALGLLTRPSSFLIFVTMSVAVFIRHASDPLSGSRELALVYACLAVMFMGMGSGRFGIDAVLRRRA